MAAKIVSFTLNGRETEVLVRPLETLQSLLRNQMGYTATKSGCKQGGCGSCTVLVDGEPMLSCLLPVEEIADQEVVTLEGVTPTDGLDLVQEVFYEKYATQCGYCTPGMILVTKALLAHTPNPSRTDIQSAITGNFCRCTGYGPIIEAVEEAARRSHGSEEKRG